MSLFQELKRRNVFRAGIAYLVGAWLLLQASDVLISLLELPVAIGKGVVLLLVLGFVPTLAFAWAYQLTPEGLKRDADVGHDPSVAPQTGRRLNALILVMAVTAAVYFFWESRIAEMGSEPSASNADPASAKVSAVKGSDPISATPGAAVTDKSIAVLPFVNMSAEPENEYFADGLSEEILNQLAQVPELRVIGRTSSFAFKGQNADLREIGEKLDSANLLEGSVRRQGDQLRVTAQLIASADGAHLWSQTWDRKMDDIFAIQDEIAQGVVRALNVVLDETTRGAMLSAGVRNVDAFVAYQRGTRLYLDAHGKDDMYEMMLEANAWLDQAIAAAPEFADAWAAKTDYFAHRVLDGELTEAERLSALESMRSLQQTAMQLASDPQRRSAIDLDRIFFTEDWRRLPGVLSEYLAAEGCAVGNWMELVVPFGNVAELEQHYRRQIACDPLMMLNYGQLASLRIRQGDLEEASAVLDEARALAGDHRWLSGASLQLDLASGQAEAALLRLRAQASKPPRADELRRQLRVLAFLGRIDEARTVLDEAQRIEPMPPLAEVLLPAILGDRAAANAAAARMDASPGGPVELIRGVINGCDCGAPFDLEATPNLAARLAEAGFAWPPPTIINFPAKDW